MISLVWVFGGILIVFICYMIYLAHHDHIRYENITHGKIPSVFNGYKIFFIADIHRRRLNKKTLLQLKESPDIVCIGGDIMERGVPFQRVRENIKLLKEWDVPIYFVWGNNDYEAQPNKIIRILKEEDVVILEDTVHIIKKGNENINVVGFDFYYDYFEDNSLMDWKALQGSFTILLTHKPSAYTMLEENKKQLIDFVLAGHTHGGQIRFFGIGLYKKGGIERIKETILLTTEGYGYSLLPFRLGTKSECHLLILNSNDS